MRVETPAARPMDPESSHLQADDFTRSGQRAAQMHRVAAALRCHGQHGITTRELAEIAGFDRHAVGRRMKECEHAGLARRGEVVRRGPHNRPEQVWRPVAGEPEQQDLDL